MKDEEKVGEKKMKTAKKMFRSDEECEKCGSKKHSSKDHISKEGKMDKASDDKWSSKDEKKDKREYKDKGELGKHAWET